jgi:hypothetical protein
LALGDVQLFDTKSFFVFYEGLGDFNDTFPDWIAFEIKPLQASISTEASSDQLSSFGVDVAEAHI